MIGTVEVIHNISNNSQTRQQHMNTPTAHEHANST
jgi:hypothetical protein